MTSAAIQYEVRWRKAVDPDTSWSSPVNVGADGHVDVPGLTSVDDYVFQARARSGCGAWSAWAVQQFNHPTPTLPAPSLPDVDGAPDGVHITFAADPQASNLWYEIQRAPDQEGVPGAWVTVAKTQSTVWDDVVTDTAEYWYRFRTVDYDGNVSEWVTLSSPVAASVSSVEQAADATQRFAAVTAQFADVDDDVQAAQQAADAANAGVTALQAQVNDLTQVSEWNQAQAYTHGDTVKHDGNLYAALQDVPVGTPITDTAYWQNIGDYSSLGEAVAANTTALTVVQQTQTAQGGAISANTQTIQSNTSAIGTKASVSALQTTNTNVAQNASGIAVNGADIALLGAHNGAKSAFVLNQGTVQIDAGGTTLGQYLASVQADSDAVNARVDTETSARVSGDSANATALQAISVRMPSGTGTIATEASVTTAQSTANTANGTANTANGKADTALSKISATYTLQLNVNNYVSGIIANNNGAISNFTIVADNFAILPSSGSGARTEFSGGNWRIYDSNNVLRIRFGVW